MSLFLCGCGGKPLSEREIVRGILFTRQQASYSVCLVLANQSEDSSGSPQDSIVAAQGTTPAQALQNAEECLYGDVYYGLLDLAVLPADADWSTAQEIGSLLYENAQPAPELSVFLLDTAPIESWAEQGSTLYTRMKEIETTYKVHCGLQQLFSQQSVCAIPADSSSGGYDFVLLAREAAPIRCHDLSGAQLAAALCGQTNTLRGTFAAGQAVCESRVQVLVDDSTVQLHLYDTALKSLNGTSDDLQVLLREELKRSFLSLSQATQNAVADPFHLQFWSACTYGVQAPTAEAQLEVIFD